ncbi:TetR/AcrR family transcriptional regulator [Paenibacillus glycanilyticus]|uniref:TetR/AcrR family transcriptional regulator n=1 Tax=Paenibacillus glycanilyticus TaxID=126569 RepID=UPI0020409A83|nr:TetR/AcrR family transcriptional regulator [Paenibacillus glycanilyticus]MCM3627012.1 TetR/AcrR family transcriptional regulator [Paenibacillus glycanilyticus]
MNTSSANTRVHIMDTFLHIYESLPLERIHIKMLTEAADINRGTFYLHFFNLEDLITSIENEHLEAIKERGNKARHLYLSEKNGEFMQYFIPIFQYMEQHHKVLRILTGPHSRPHFREGLLKVIRQNALARFESILSSCNGADLIKRDLLMESVINGNLGILVRWIQSDMNLPPEELASLMSQTVFKSPMENMLTL